MHAALQQAVEASRGMLVAVWLESCGVAETIDAAVEALEIAARATWPRWFVGRDEPAPDATIDACLERAGRLPGVSSQWLRAAWANAEAGRPWGTHSFAAAVPAHQLALALDPERLVMALAAELPEPDELLGLVRAVEWLAVETSAVSVLALPASLAGAEALDAAAYSYSRSPRLGRRGRLPFPHPLRAPACPTAHRRSSARRS